MDSIERFYATVAREKVDRPACWLGVPDEDALPGLFKEYNVSNLHDLRLAVGDDFYAVRIPYRFKGRKSARVWDWYLDGVPDQKDRTLTAPGCFADCETIEDIAFFKWPSVKESVNSDDLQDLIHDMPENKTGLALLWSVHFQDVCAAFGMETCLMNMITNPELVEYVNNKILAFYLEADDLFLKTIGTKFQAVLFGNDMGSQRGLMLSPELVRRFVIPGVRALADLAHRYGKKVIYHSCGSIEAIIPDLIAAGVDVIHPIQAQAAGMAAENLKEKYANKVSFCGGVDAQDLLVHGTAAMVAQRVKELRELFPTGLIISPSHEAILPDVPPSNIRALFSAATEI